MSNAPWCVAPSSPTHAARGETCGERDGVLFFYAHVKETVGEFFGEPGHAAARCHGGSYAHDPRVGGGKFAQYFAEYVLVAGNGARLRLPLAGFRVELARGVPYHGIGLGGGVSLALYRVAVKDARAADVAQWAYPLPFTV